MASDSPLHSHCWKELIQTRAARASGFQLQFPQATSVLGTGGVRAESFTQDERHRVLETQREETEKRVGFRLLRGHRKGQRDWGTARMGPLGTSIALSHLGGQ